MGRISKGFLESATEVTHAEKGFLR
jgi:hypothetical protein